MPKMITVFRSRLKPDNEVEYAQWAERIDGLARAMPGYLGHKGFAAEDGERVTIVEFESAQAQQAWRMHPDHTQAQQLGRSTFYSEYSIQVCELQRESRFPR